MIQFTVTNMVSDAQTGIVKEIQYTAKGSIGESVGSLCLAEPGDDFTPFSELTPSIVQSWVEQLGLYDPQAIDDSSAENNISTVLPWQ